MRNIFVLILLFTIQSTLNAQVSKLKIADGDVIALKADTGKYLARCQGCQNATATNTATVHVTGNVRTLPSYALFTVKKMSNGKFAFRADTGKYLARCRGCVRGGPSDILTVHESNPHAGYAQFEVQALINGKFTLRADTKNYVARCQGCSPRAAKPNIAAIHVPDYSGAYAQWTITLVKRNRR